jgi:hypothetical protein
VSSWLRRAHVFVVVVVVLFLFVCWSPAAYHLTHWIMHPCLDHCMSQDDVVLRHSSQLVLPSHGHCCQFMCPYVGIRMCRADCAHTPHCWPACTYL